jgi:hypothetical protein
MYREIEFLKALLKGKTCRNCWFCMPHNFRLCCGRGEQVIPIIEGNLCDAFQSKSRKDPNY